MIVYSKPQDAQKAAEARGLKSYQYVVRKVEGGYAVVISAGRRPLPVAIKGIK